MAFLNSIEQLRQVEWGRKYLWDIKFEKAPVPFNEFFPAVDVEEDKAVLETFTIEEFMEVFEVPLKSGIKAIRITFLDDANNTLVDWLSDWINRSILNNGKHISTLEKSVKQVTLLKLNSRRESLSGQEMSYWVIPKGQITYNGSSSSDPQTYSVTFVIVGQISDRREFEENNP